MERWADYCIESSEVIKLFKCVQAAAESLKGKFSS